MSINKIVDVQISRQTTAVSKAGFGTALILGIHSQFDPEEYIRFYDSMEAVESNFSSSTEEYKAAVKLFGQENAPQRIAIGQRDDNEQQKTHCLVINDLDDTDYTTIINGTAFTINSGAGASSASIAGALVTAINAGNEPVTAIDNADGTYDLEADLAGDSFTVSVDDNQSYQEIVANKNVASELSKISNQNDEWYAIIITRRGAEAEQIQDIKHVSEWTEARMKLYGTSIDQASILTSAEDDIASFLKAKAYDRTFIIFSKDYESYPEAGWFGSRLPTDPGSSTWKFKTLSGISVDTLTETEKSNAQDKNANIYTQVGGVNITEEGIVASGEFIDIIRGVDWLKARLEERIYSKLVNLEKIPYTDKGTGVIETEIRAQLIEGIRKGFIAEDPAPTVTVPLVANISQTDRINRFLPDVSFLAQLAGAVHTVAIRGVVTV